MTGMQFQLTVGDAVPRQQSPTTCGAAALTMARMLVDPDFAAWIATGSATPGVGAALDRPSEFSPGFGGAQPHGGGQPFGGASGDERDERFAAYEQVVHRRTTRFFGAAGRAELPWPRRLGTPPWGAEHELANGIAAPGTDYQTRWIRWASPDLLERAYLRLVQTVCPRTPALLYVGSTTLPRHVLLLLEATDGVLGVYDPSRERAIDLPRERFGNGRFLIAGWNTLWCLVEPRPRSGA